MFNVLPITAITEFTNSTYSKLRGKRKRRELLDAARGILAQLVDQLVELLFSSCLLLSFVCVELFLRSLLSFRQCLEELSFFEEIQRLIKLSDIIIKNEN